MELGTKVSNEKRGAKTGVKENKENFEEIERGGNNQDSDQHR